MLLATFLEGLGVPWMLEIAMTFLAVAGLVTVVQRSRSVYRQAKAT